MFNCLVAESVALDMNRVMLVLENSFFCICSSILMKQELFSLNFFSQLILLRDKNVRGKKRNKKNKYKGHSQERVNYWVPPWLK